MCETRDLKQYRDGTIKRKPAEDVLIDADSLCRFLFLGTVSVEEKPESAAAEDAKTWTPARIAETYWEVFSGCFEGYDFNPVTFRFHEDGWDSASQMALVAGLEAAFGISFKGREVLKMNSFESGLKLVRKKLDEKNREEG